MKAAHIRSLITISEGGRERERERERQRENVKGEECVGGRGVVK